MKPKKRIEPGKHPVYAVQEIRKLYRETYAQKKCVWRKTPSGVVERLARLNPKGPVLDLGAGEGRDAIFLAKCGLQVTAVDLMKVALQRLKARAEKEGVGEHIRTVQTDFTRFRFPRKFGVVTSLFALQHVGPGAQKVLIRRLKANTLPGGHNVISAFTNRGEWTPRPSYFHPGELKSLYREWKIVYYEEKPVKTLARGPNGKVLVQVAAQLIAQKPLN